MPRTRPKRLELHFDTPRHDRHDAQSTLVNFRDVSFFPFRLVATTSRSASQIRVPESPYLTDFKVIEVENRGRDVRPFLRALAETHDFDIGLKLHTKRSPQRSDGGLWLAKLIDSLLPPGRSLDIVDRLVEAKTVGLVAPEGFCLPVEPWILQNRAAMETVTQACGHSLVNGDLDDCYFAAGSMFWFRRHAIVSLAIPSVLSLFEEEAGQLDGTIAHGVERLFAVETKRNGLQTVAMPALMSSGEVSPDGLRAATRQHSQEPNALFPGPYIEAKPVLDDRAHIRMSHWTDPIRSILRPLYRNMPRSVRDRLMRLIGR